MFWNNHFQVIEICNTRMTIERIWSEEQMAALPATHLTVEVDVRVPVNTVGQSCSVLLRT